jgi:osmotically-inducible protein OsmY
MLIKNMMRLFILIFVALLTGCVSSAFSGANVVYHHKQLQEDASDCYIKIRSWNQLKKEYPQDALRGIHIESFHKVLIVTGQVPTDELRSQIAASLKTIPKVVRIYNATTVGPPATTKEQVQDSWLTTKVKSKMIASNELYADKVKVITEKQVVYLIGIVTHQEGQCAIDLAKSTDGVNQVVTFFYYMTMPEIN